MKWWSYIQPGNLDGDTEYHIYSEDYIIHLYFKYWTDQLIKKYKERAEEYITASRCLDDWVTVHWAEEFSIDRLHSFWERNSYKGVLVFINGKLLSN